MFADDSDSDLAAPGGGADAFRGDDATQRAFLQVFSLDLVVLSVALFTHINFQTPAGAVIAFVGIAMLLFTLACYVYWRLVLGAGAGKRELISLRHTVLDGHVLLLTAVAGLGVWVGVLMAVRD